MSCNLDSKVKIKGQILYFLVNASPPKLLDIGHMIIMSCCTVSSVSDVEGTGQQLM